MNVRLFIWQKYNASKTWANFYNSSRKWIIRYSKKTEKDGKKMKKLKKKYISWYLSNLA